MKSSIRLQGCKKVAKVATRKLFKFIVVIKEVARLQPLYGNNRTYLFIYRDLWDRGFMQLCNFC